MNTLLILGHPRADSLSAALARAYADGAKEAGVSLRTLTLSEMKFDVHVRRDSPEMQPLEPALQHARDDIAWADHLVFVFPTWWGTMPALLKGFLDRLVMPGFAFRFYGASATDWQGFWSGKSAQLITTMDTPPPVYRWLYRAPGINALRKATLGFCGVRPVDALAFGPVRTSTPEQRAGWLSRVRRAGIDLHPASRKSRWRRAVGRLSAWLAALRLQFYPMSLAAYTVGALFAATDGIALVPYAAGMAGIFFLEAATVLSNDWCDFESDRVNCHPGPFNGGSRVLVRQQLCFGDLRRAIAVCLVLAAATPGVALLPILLAPVLTLGYTLPPLRLSYRLLGELDVAVTHSLLVVFLGYALQGGTDIVAPLYLSLPLCIAILPSIVLAGVPDFAADRTVGKRTVAVAFGERAAVRIAMAALVAAAALGVAFDAARVSRGAFEGLAWFAVPHAVLGLWLLRRLLRRQGELGRIDVPLVGALTYILWFIAIPIYRLA